MPSLDAVPLLAPPLRTARSALLTSRQALLAKTIALGLRPLRTLEAKAAFAAAQWDRFDHDVTQVRNVALLAPPNAAGEPDPYTYTRAGFFAGVPSALSSDLYLYLYDAKGQLPSGASGKGGPQRVIRLDERGLEALVQVNEVKALGRAFTTLFQNLGTGLDRAAEGWTMR
jgi:hypothetical protein